MSESWSRFRATLTAPVPDGWLVRESVELVSAPQSAYAVASSVTLSPGTTAEQFAESQRVLSEGLPSYEGLAVETVELADGQPAVLRSFSWAPPDGAARSELHLCAVQGQRGILARAVSSAERFAEVEPTLRELLLGIGLGAPASRGGVLRRESTPREQTYAAFEAGQLTTTRAKAFGIESSIGERER
jgi:hypothetical protein